LLMTWTTLISSTTFWRGVTTRMDYPGDTNWQ
jgi:hypothetical protein